MAKQKFTTTLDSELIKQLKIQAIRENCSVAEILEQLISDYLKNNQEQLNTPPDS